MAMKSLRHLFEDQLKDLYSAETQLTKALPRMAKKASSEELGRVFEHHLEETTHQIGRLTKIADELGMKLSGKKCKAMEGLIQEGAEVLDEEGDESVIDAALVAVAQRVEHYEISAYGTARALAEQLGKDEVAAQLQESLDEEAMADRALTDICQNNLFPALASSRV